ncbi:MAG TPA: glucose-6-phosphate dehydrogenase [Nitriliruptoraceae bacterium]|nr:glucose-6-phosphate dehydrogenase [Nitriliruptoraceae bacterium]
MRSTIHPKHDRSDALVLFGITGDLAYKKLFPALHDLEAHEDLDFPVIGVARSDWTLDELKERAEASMREHVEDLDEDAMRTVIDRLEYVQGDYGHPDTFERLNELLDDCSRPLAYLAIPPSLFDEVVEGLDRIGANTRGGGVVVEKPFGRDLESAQELDDLLRASFPEELIYRIDHFLGKETVLDVMLFRLANPVLDTLLHRHEVDHIQITMAEDFGIEGRGGFYDSVGAVRDVVQNHLLQIMAVFLADPPVSDDPEALRDEKAKVLKAMRPMDPAEMVRGQYVGYLDVDQVAPDSTTETFVSLIARVETWRWSDVPIHIRAGKAMAETRTEIAVVFKRPPLSLYRGEGMDEPPPNTLRFRLKPGERIDLGIQLKEPGEEISTHGVHMTYEWKPGQGRHTEAYARLLGDAIKGDRTLFARSDSVMAAWSAVQPLIDEPGPVHPYQPGTQGPPEADRVAPPGGWLRPLYGDE